MSNGKVTEIDSAKTKKNLNELLGGYSGPTLDRTKYRKAVEKQKRQEQKDDVHGLLQENWQLFLVKSEKS